MKRNFLKLLPVVLIGFTVAVGCGKKNVTEDISGSAADKNKPAEVVTEQKPAQEQVQSQDLPAAAPKTGGEYASVSPGDTLTKQASEKGELYTVHFDFDKYNIRDEDKALLEKNAKWLNLNKKVKIAIEGHADERGETEYNLALGDKRARSVAKYLEALGVSKDRVSTISYGEEKPVDQGHDEAAWAKNRRAEFKITSN